MAIIFDEPLWQHHRSGWKHVYPELKKISTIEDIIFNGHLDLFFSNGGEFNKCWIGFLHNVPKHPQYGKYLKWLDLETILKTDKWKKSQRFCRGLYVLSPYLAEYLSDKVNVPVCSLYLPHENTESCFSFDEFLKTKRIVMVGHWMRKFKSMFDLKIKIENQIVWSHHRSGWKDVITAIFANSKFNGVQFEGWLDGFFSFNNTLLNPWIGFFHCTPEHPTFGKYNTIKSLSQILESDCWKQSEKYCKGIFVLSEYLESYLKELGVNVPIVCLKHPVADCDIKFDIDLFNNDKKLVVVGQWMRRFESIFYVDVNYNKCLLKTGHGSELQDMNFLKNTVGERISEVNFLERKSDKEYDKLLESSIVFLDLYDVAANNTILDCIVRNTPVLINKLRGAVDYLGEDYPFYFSSLEEASIKAQDLNLIKETNEYLKNLSIKKELTIEHFIESFKNSIIYRRLNTRIML
jgi:hypothetical protein